jgi:hypothetical protein
MIGPDNPHCRSNDMKRDHVSGSFVVVVAGVASGGEITGNGKSLQIAPHTLNGNSSCAFSGRQDDPATAIAEGFKGEVAQSWGQLVKGLRDFLTSIGVSPGVACNPTKAGGEP